MTNLQLAFLIAPLLLIGVLLAAILSSLKAVILLIEEGLDTTTSSKGGIVPGEYRSVKVNYSIPVPKNLTEEEIGDLKKSIQELMNTGDR